MFTISSAERAALHEQERRDLAWFEQHPDADEFFRPIVDEIDPWLGRRGVHGQQYAYVLVLRIRYSYRDEVLYVPAEPITMARDTATGTPFVDSMHCWRGDQ